MTDFTVEDLLVALLYDGEHFPLQVVRGRIMLYFTPEGVDVTALFGQAYSLGYLTVDCNVCPWFGFDMTKAGVEVARKADYDQFTTAIRWKVPQV